MVDYIVVGGGSAGCVIASRLSEDSDSSVLLLEKGSRDWNPYIHIPVTYFKVFTSKMLAQYQLEPTAAQNGQVQTMVQANVLGGGSSVNAMVYVRGCPEDYDAWASGGADGWSYREVLPFFMRAEDNDSLAGAAHGTGGPLGVSDQRFTHPMTKDWLKACQDMGMPLNPDFNSGTQQGCGLYQLTTRNGARSSAVSFLRQAKGRRNLVSKTGIQVLRILIERGRAVGVEYLEKGRTVVARADREVIVCSGAIGSPHLLLRSGIGPADQLKAHDVPVALDLPGVGENLRDHTLVYMTYQLNHSRSYDRYKKLRWQAWAGLQYGMFRSGPATSNIVEGGAFWYGQRGDPLPDLQYCFFPGAAMEHGMDSVPGDYGCTICVGQTRPRSRGTIRLRSGDPLAPPLIDPNYFADPYDLQSTVDGVRLGQDLMRQPAIAKHIARQHIPEPLHTQHEFEEFVRRTAMGGTHPTGACKMGTDSMAVVDPQLRVHGIEGLRVADSSIMPSMPSGNTNAPSIMIGERAADFIRGNRFTTADASPA